MTVVSEMLFFMQLRCEQASPPANSLTSIFLMCHHLYFQTSSNTKLSQRSVVELRMKSLEQLYKIIIILGLMNYEYMVNRTMFKIKTSALGNFCTYNYYLFIRRYFMIFYG